ncbi:hypothetical protein lerEdw1_007872 [Lerista edwardsae]|nr:hypothetical protein lerEdw1_007872 [Lerista edwardsae]
MLNINSNENYNLLFCSAAKLLDKNLFSVSTPNPLLPSPASLQLAQLQAQLTLHRLKLAQTAVTNNTAAATVLNQVLSKVAMSQPLFNQLRHPSMFNNPQGHAGGPGVANSRFPPGGLHFPTPNPTLAAAGGALGPIGNLQNQNPNAMAPHPFGGVISQTPGQQTIVMGLNKTGIASTTGGFYDYSKHVFPSDAEQCSPHGLVTSGSHSVPTSSGGGTYDGNFAKHDNQPGFQKEFYGTTSKGQHTTGVQSLSFVADPHHSHPILSQKGEAGPIVHETETNNQWENSSTFTGQNKPDNMPSASMWPSASVRYEIRNDLYNPEEPTPDIKFSASAPHAFSRANSSKQNFNNSRMRQTQEPLAAASDLAVRPHGLSDFHCIAPACFPHVCSMCDKKVFDLKDWDQHVKGNLHIQKCMAFSENTDIRCVLSSAEGILHSSSPNNTTVFNLSNIDDYPLNAGSSYNSASSFDQQGSTFSSVPSTVNLPQRKCSPGRVVHICNLPEGSCTENDVINLGLPFGKVTNYILMKSTNQAFLEMAYTEAAQAMVQYYKEKPAMINEDKLLIRMSKRYRELQLKKPGKNVAAIIQDIHSQRERDLWETDRYGPERPRSRSPISRSLSPRSRTPSFTSCSSPHSPLNTNRTDWGNGREPWDQPSYSRREEEREVVPWRENGEEKRERTDTWVEKKDSKMETSPFPTNMPVKDTEDLMENLRKEKEQDWESGSEMEAETWYPTNMEELVTVDEVGEDDLIMEPDITELEEIVTVGQKQQECSEDNPIAAAEMEVKDEHDLLNRTENKSNAIEANLRSEEKTTGTFSGSGGDDAATKASHLNTDTEQKPDELHEGRPPRDSNYHDKERKINENTDTHLKVEDPPKEEFLQQSDTFVDDYKEMASLESENRTAMEVLVKSSQEETSYGSQEHEKTQGNLYIFPPLFR